MTDAFRQAAVCVCGGHGFVGLTKGHVALFSPEDLALVQDRRWFLLQGNSGCVYAASGDGGGKLLMHRLLAHTPAKLVTDHRDGDGLNNTRENLRVCTQSQNLGNKRGTARDLPKGVTVSQKKFAAAIMVNGKTRRLGTFPTPESAEAAYRQAAASAFGEFAYHARAEK